MSMLAEPRKKQKWSVDPRNSAWSNDDSKFGQKMLERMGWSKGKGLGRTEQGSTDHVKVKVKNNNFGLGTNASNEDNWIAHQDDFNELLTQLNNCHGQNNTSEIPQDDEQKNFSLEEKSKTSKKRVHYMKFTKGKDLSSRTKTDLNCIFGKRARSTKDQEQENSSSDSQGETEEVTAPLVLDTESITKTVTSTLTMQQYFAQRMASMKKAGGAQSKASSSVETSALLDDSSPTQQTENIKVPKKKKKKKKKAASEELETVAENDSPTMTEDGENQEQEPPKKKKKRKTAEAEDSTPPSIIEPDCAEMPPSKKKKKKLQKDCEESQLLKGHEPTENHAVTSATNQIKQKNSEETNGAETLDTDKPPQKKSKKKKKSHNDV